MGRTLGGAILLSFLLAAPGSSHAGVYNPGELNHLYPVPTSFNQFQITLSDIRGLARRNDNPQQMDSTEKEQLEKNEWILKYRARFENLKAVDQAGKLTVADRIELSACYLRIPNEEGKFQPEEAIRVLEPAQVQEPRNLMVLANLASAYQQAGSLDRALSYEALMLESWPNAQPGFSADQLRWYRRAEKFYYLWLTLRNRENEQQLRPEEKTLDALFGSADLVRSNDEYEAGRISPRSWAELPGDAIPIVEQLIYWLPFDNRLYWLYGELLNAKGDVHSAYEILNELVDEQRRKEQSRVLRHHWRVLQEVSTAESKEAFEDTAKNPVAQTTSWFPDLRAAAVGFAAGVVVSLLAGLQLREIRRRRELRAGRPPAGAG
jgi:hypothetical protein